MPYATQQDIIDRYGEEAFTVAADRDGDGLADAEAVERALSDADAEIDAYLAVKYELPLASTPPLLVRLAVDIAYHRLSPEADTATEARRSRYDQAVSLLKRLASGEVSLGLPEPPASASGEAHLVSNTERRFTRHTLRRLT